MDNKKILIPEQVKTIRSHFSYQTIWMFIESKGKELYGENFCLHPEDVEIVLKLIVWFIRDKDQEGKIDIDLNKGILLVGPVGCGKTTLMNICRFLIPAENRHSLKACRDVSNDFAKEGYDSLQRYTKGSFSPYKGEPKTWCFDDLGQEHIMQHYGNECSVMTEILLSRYDYYHSFNMITHITTNLNSDEIQQRYGIRVRSRLRELCNLVAFPATAPDKRK